MMEPEGASQNDNMTEWFKNSKIKIFNQSGARLPDGQSVLIPFGEVKGQWPWGRRTPLYELDGKNFHKLAVNH